MPAQRVPKHAGGQKEDTVNDVSRLTASPATHRPQEGRPLDYSGPSTTRRRKSSGGLVALLLVVGFGGLALFTFVVPSMCRSSEQANRAKCANNLRQIALAAILYASQNDGQFPDTPNQILLTQEITPEVFVCPSSTDERAQGDTPEALAVDLTAGHHLSYVYVGKGLS